MMTASSDGQLELAAIIHDLRNPLTVIVAHTQLTQRSLRRAAVAPSAQVEDGLAEIQSLARQMIRMLDDLLATPSRPEHDTATRDPSVTNLTAVLAGAAEQVEQALGQRRIHLQLPGRPIAVTSVEGDGTTVTMTVPVDGPSLRSERPDLMSHQEAGRDD